MWYSFSFVFLFIALAMVFVLFNMVLSWLLSTKKPNEIKTSPYECGNIPTVQAWSKFNPRFFLIALLFLMFDVEVALIFPVAMVYKEMAGLFVFLEVIVFLLILFVALVYTWGKGDLEWVKKSE